ncbi:hypothetical protein ZWY2020_059461 [Hordeum vulgare]|nr:hypothetical protein ZWY2020_059461 [Hordeum vulgare]
MGGLRLSAWAAAPSPSPASAPRGFPRSPPDWRGPERGRRSHCTPSSPPVLSLGAAGRLRVGADREWLWDCRGGGLGRGGWGKDYAKEMEAAVRVVQLACTLWQRVQDSLLLADPGPGSGSGSGDVHSKLDRSPVTVADWGVQATVSWLLSDYFGGESVSIVAEEDDKTLTSSDGQAWMQPLVHDFEPLASPPGGDSGALAGKRSSPGGRRAFLPSSRRDPLAEMRQRSWAYGMEAAALAAARWDLAALRGCGGSGVNNPDRFSFSDDLWI